MKSNGYLVDTQVFIWLMQRSPRLKRDLLLLLANPQVHLYLSTASIWEIILKRAKTPLKVPKNIVHGVEKAGFLLLPIDLEHILKVETLPLLHKDPFDRILIAQAHVEGLTLVTSDRKIWKYKLPILKA